MISVIAAILKGLIGGEVKKAVGNDPAAGAIADYGLGKLDMGGAKVPAGSHPENNYVEPRPDATIETTTPAQSMYDKFRQDNYMRSIGERMR